MNAHIRRAIVEKHFNKGGTSAELADLLDLSPASAYVEATKYKSRHNHPDNHHPKEKTAQINKILGSQSGLKIYEVFAGQGGCTRAFEQFGTVVSKTRKMGHARKLTHQLLASGETFDVIDIDGYGWTADLLHMRIFDALKVRGTLFLTIPLPQNSRGSGATLGRNKVNFGASSPAIEHVIDTVKITSLRCGREAKLLDVQMLGTVWRFAFRVTSHKARHLWGSAKRKGLHSPF